jgi:tRNA U34 5-methylaminomethyl-2-thiouridine-forming methyltransferase MnmC
MPDQGPGWRGLSLMEEEHLHTRAAVPFRDPSGADDSAAILRRRSMEQDNCRLESTNAWQRRWREESSGCSR